MKIIKIRLQNKTEDEFFCWRYDYLH